MMAQALSDIRYACRGLRKTPVFTAVAILSIALGIGANTAIFTIVDQLLLRLLPVKDPRQLVLVTGEGFQYGNGWGEGNELSYPRFADLRDNNQVFSAMFCRFASDSTSASVGRRKGSPVNWCPAATSPDWE
jgi:hypothetical protein